MPRKNYPRKKRTPQRLSRQLSVRSQLRAEPDLPKYARAVIALAIAQAERDASAMREQQERGEKAGADD